MKRILFSPKTSFGVKVAKAGLGNGGTDATTAAQAAVALDAVSLDDIGDPMGSIPLVSGKIPASYVQGADYVKVIGATSLGVNVSRPFTITNFDYRTTYIVTANGGTVSRVRDTITYTAPATAGTYGFTVNGRVIPVLVTTVGEVLTLRAPVILVPTAGTVGVGATLNVASNACFVIDGADASATHTSTVWQLSTESTFTDLSKILLNVSSGSNSGILLTSWYLVSLALGTTYYIRCKYINSLYGTSPYSEVRSFTTNLTNELTETAKLTVSEAVSGDQLGCSVSVVSDGTRCIIGAYGGNSSKGTAYVFSRSGTAWTKEAKLIASDGASGDKFGSSVAISLDGTRCVIGAYGDDGFKGSAYVFSRTGPTWTQEAKLIAIGQVVGDQFGESIAISLDGTRCVIGAISTDSSKGAAYVFSRTGTTWTQEAKLVASDGLSADQFGKSVCLSSDGTRCAIGTTSASATNGGAAYVFSRTDTTWTQEAKLVESNGVSGDEFGYSVSISSDGSRCVIGATRGNSFKGSAYVFSRSGTIWTQEAKLIASDGLSGDRFGSSVSISSDGTCCAIGAYNNIGAIGNTGSAGAVYMFLRAGTSWTQNPKLVAGDGVISDRFGCSVSVVSDGTRCAIGAVGNNGIGAAYVFD